jgi:hypothetical protein
MKIGDNGFNVGRSLKYFIASAQESDKEFSIMPINNKCDNICRATNLQNTKDGIRKYYRHIIKINKAQLGTEEGVTFR